MGYRRMSALRPIHRIKHVVDGSNSITAGSQLDIPLVIASDTPDLATTQEVETGAKVNGIYLKVEVAANEAEAGIPNVYLIVWKNPGDNLSTPAANAVGPNDNKRYVIHQEMIMLNSVLKGNPRILFNGVIVIPKGMRRMGPNDRLEISVLAPLINIHECHQAHFKEFR